MSDFLADNNLCGQTLLKLVSSGNAILAQLLRLKDNIPHVFRPDTKENLVKEVIVDLKYFSEADSFEKKIDQNQLLLDTDNELRESYLEILTQFYLLFESIFKYVNALNKFVDDVHDGIYIQMSLESILYNGEGRQILAESIYLYGCMLLLVDKHIEGPVRERMLTSFYRFGGLQNSDTNVDDVCKLLRSTKKTPTYPLEYFQRVPVNKVLIQLVLGRLRSDDVYNQLGSYPLPEHRTTALAAQASILVIVLFFAPPVLQSENATMREICDKFFHDNWIIPIYMGFSLNLVECWNEQGFKSAKQALDLCKPMRLEGRIQNLTLEASKALKEGILVEDNILERANRVISLLRESNVVLRWALLHTGPLNPDLATKKTRQMRDAVLLESKCEPEAILNLLLHVAQLEQKVRELYKKLLEEKRVKWLELRTEACERVKELAEVFSGNKPLTRIEVNEKLSHWLQKKAGQIESLDFEQLNSSGRKIIELIRAMDEMLEFHNLESQVQVREWVSDTTNCLHKMLRTGSINEDTLVTLQIVGDLGYAWGSLIDTLTPQMQGLIHKDPYAVSKLRAVFLKLSSAMDMPLMRLSQAKSSDLVSVSSYYSGELVAYVQKVLQIIPESVFSLLHRIIELQTDGMKELPTRLDKDKVKDFAQLENRQKVSRLTHDMSALTEGILMMQTTLVGIIRIDPKVLLENGIRKELVRQMTQALVSTLGHNQQRTNGGTLYSKLELVAQRIDGIRRSFEYIGDYVNAHGLKIYQEEFSRLINFATEQECNVWAKVKVLPFQSIYQSKEVPITLSITDSEFSSSNFMGKIVHDLLALTEASKTVYVADTSSWYEVKSHAPMMTPEVFKIMEKALDIVGLVGIDKLISFHLAKELEKLTNTLRAETLAHRDFLIYLYAELQPPTKLQNAKNYPTWTGKVHKSIASNVLRIGQLQLLRKRILYQLRVSASLNAKQLFTSVDLTSRLITMGLHENKETAALEELAFEVGNQCEPLGVYDPLSKVYITLNPIQHVPLYLALLTIQQIKKLTFSKSIASLTCRKASDGIDGLPLVIGLSTVLNQLHSSQTLSYLAHICQFMNSLIIQATPTNSKDEDLSATFSFITLFTRHSCRAEYSKFVKLLVPCFSSLPSLLN